MAIAIKIEHLSKAYQLGEFSTGTISRDIERWWYKMRGKEDPFLIIGETNDRAIKGSSGVIWSLKDINFEIHKGDTVGIIGRNGAGKSTLLKLLSRVTAPTSGNIKVKGRIASLLEVGTGFHPELTGKENIFLNGAILGMRKKEIVSKFDEIVDFAGVEQYINTPVKRYSSGMYVRLAFAVAAHLESEILIVDEILAVGDAEFQKKCLGKMNEVSKGEGRTVLFVSHNMGSIMQLCKYTILMQTGRLIQFGSTSLVVKKYLQEGTSQTTVFAESNQSDKKIWFKKIFPSDKEGQVKDQFFHNEEVYFNFEVGFNIPCDSHSYSVFFMVLDENKIRVFSSESQIITSTRLRLIIEANFLVRGSYSIHTFIHKPAIEQIDVAEDVCDFQVMDNGSPLFIHGDYDYGKVFGRSKWKQIEVSETIT